MTTSYARLSRLPRLPTRRFRQDFSLKPRRAKFEYIERLMCELDEFERVVRDEWTNLGAEDRMMMRALVLGVRPPVPGSHPIADFVGDLVDHAKMAFAIAFFREEVVRYFARAHAVSELVKARVSVDVWNEVDADPARVEQMAAGLADVQAGRTTEVAER